jgi:hypothetical protein
VKPEDTILWEVRGVDQHGEEIVFNMYSQEDAEWHEARFTRLGGKVKITKMVFDAPYAGWLPEDKEERERRMRGKL